MILTLPDTPAVLPVMPDGGPPLIPSFEELVEDVGLQEHEVAYALWEKYKETSFKDMLEPFERSEAWLDAAEAEANHRMGAFADSLNPIYLLIMKDDKVYTLFGWKACRALGVGGTRYAGLLGDRKRSTQGMEIPPKLFTTGSTIANQKDYFRRHAVFAKNFQDIQQALEENPDWDLCDEPDVLEGDAEGFHVNVLRALPVHPKLAVLFFRGVPVRKAFETVVQVYHATPEDHRATLRPLLQFVRAGVTHEIIQDIVKSKMQMDWTLKEDLTSTEGLEEWYLALLDNYALRWTPGPLRQFMQGNPADLTGQAGQPPPVYHSASQPLALTSESLVALTNQGQARQSYSARELRQLLLVANVEGPHDVCTSDQLPLFWQGLELVRRTQLGARRHIEEFLASNYPQDKMTYVYVLAPNTIKDISTLDFTGGDVSSSWSLRHKGLSVFSLLPLEDAADVGPIKEAYQAFEDTTETHTPTDRANMQKLVQDKANLAKDRLTFYRAMDFLNVVIEIMFSQQCRLLSKLDLLRTIVSSPARFGNHHFREWRCYVWKLHIALREFFSPGNSLDSMDCLLSDLRQGKVIHEKEVPAQILSDTT